MDAALKYLGYCARTAREVERRLDALEYGEVEVYETLERLKELGLVNDAAFAQDFIASRLATKPVSRAHLREQLLSHETGQEAIEDALRLVTDQVERSCAVRVAAKYLRQFEALDEETRTQRTIQRLLSRGYTFDTAREAVENALAGADTDE